MVGAATGWMIEAGPWFLACDRVGGQGESVAVENWSGRGLEVGAVSEC